MSSSFKQRTVLVTGGSRGIGRHTCIGFAKKGANVIINYNKSHDEANKVLEEVETFGVRGLCVKCNVSKEDEVDNMFKLVTSEFGQVDILINNAGIYEDNVVWKMSQETWQKVIDNDLTSVFNCTKHALNSMRKKIW